MFPNYLKRVIKGFEDLKILKLIFFKASLAPLAKDFELEDSNDAKAVESKEPKNVPGGIPGC